MGAASLTNNSWRQKEIDRQMDTDVRQTDRQTWYRQTITIQIDRDSGRTYKNTIRQINKPYTDQLTDN